MNPKSIFEKNILFAALNWGNGHVARSIGLIQQLMVQNNAVTIACSVSQQEIFSVYFPNSNFLFIEDYPFSFSGKGNFSKDLWISRKKLKNHFKYESQWISETVSNYSFDYVISDHRYGFRSDRVHSIFLTHQLNLPLNWWQFPVKWVHTKLVKRFDELWVLDDVDSSLAGKLSVNSGFKNVHYIGFYSRFMLYEIKNQKEIDELVICNGPHPYDEYLLLQFLKEDSKKIIASKRLAEKYTSSQVYSSENWKECDALILNAKKIYSYCGYTTLMDLQYLKCEHELFPTKGQAEQAYLFNLHCFKK